MDTTLLILRRPFEQPVNTAAVELKKACLATNLFSSSQVLFTRWPNLRDSSERLASLLTLYWPDQRKVGESLLVNCLKTGLIMADETFRCNNDDLEQQKAYIRSISKEFGTMLGVSLMVKHNGRWVAYDPGIDASLDQLINSKCSEEMAWHRKPESINTGINAQLVCASRIFNANELILAGLLEN